MYFSSITSQSMLVSIILLMRTYPFPPQKFHPRALILSFSSLNFILTNSFLLFNPLNYIFTISSPLLYHLAKDVVIQKIVNYQSDHQRLMVFNVWNDLLSEKIYLILWNCRKSFSHINNVCNEILFIYSHTALDYHLNVYSIKNI